ncbi:MAG: tRNA (adenosine(37)-N6)-dimethylallyltransferase MiaA [Candidatus Eiseniibacteriota bacterium]
MPERALIALVGCTATGKTEVAEFVAAALGGEVVCADSRQVFRELDVGTGKPSPEQRAARPHHLFEALTVAAYTGQRGAAPHATAGWYARVAAETCAGIHARGNTPVLVGGSGLYLRAAQRGLAPTPAIDPETRARLTRELAAGGAAALHERLAGCDPDAARSIHASDAQRITRALEVNESTGHSMRWWREQPSSAAVQGRWHVFQLGAEPAELRRRIAARTRWMFDNGLIEETRALIERDMSAALGRLRAIGYDEALELLAGRSSREAAEERTDLRTAQLAKRQRTWFRHQVESESLAADGRGAAALAAHVVARMHGSG